MERWKVGGQHEEGEAVRQHGTAAASWPRQPEHSCASSTHAHTIKLRQSSLEGLEARHGTSQPLVAAAQAWRQWRQWRQQCRTALQRCNRRCHDLSGLGAPTSAWKGLQRLRGGQARRLGSLLRLAGWPYEM